MNIYWLVQKLLAGLDAQMYIKMYHKNIILMECESKLNEGTSLCKDVR
jgi:hypothetical protein